MSAHALIVEPFETLAFMRAALVACLALALTNGAVGTLLVVRRMSLDGDVLGHAVMPGAAIGFLYAGASPGWLSLGGLASGFAVAALAGLITSERTRRDAGLVAFYLLPGVPAGVLVGFDAPALNDSDELAFVANVRRGRDMLDVLYFWNGQRLQRLVAEGERLLRIGGTMDKIGGPAMNNSGVIAFPAAIFKGPALGGIFVAGARDLRLLVGTGDRAPSGAMILRFSERVAIDNEDGIAFGTYLGQDGVTREAVLRTGPEGLDEIAAEGAPAPGGGRYAGFGPWPTVGPGGVTAFIAALDGGPGPLAAFAGAAGDIRRVASMGETLPQGELIGRFPLNAVAVAGPGDALTFATVTPGERGGQRDLLPLSGAGTLRDRAHRTGAVGGSLCWGNWSIQSSPDSALEEAGFALLVPQSTRSAVLTPDAMAGSVMFVFDAHLV